MKNKNFPEQKVVPAALGESNERSKIEVSHVVFAIHPPADACFKRIHALMLSFVHVVHTIFVIISLLAK